MTTSIQMVELVRAHHFELRRRVEKDRRVRVTRAARRAHRSTVGVPWWLSLRFGLGSVRQDLRPAPAS